MLGEYKPGEIEEKIQRFWEEKRIYKFDLQSEKPVFSIDTPPPTFSGEIQKDERIQCVLSHGI